MVLDEASEEVRALPTKFIEGWEIYRAEKLIAHPEDE
jgi:hypothetical protein